MCVCVCVCVCMLICVQLLAALWTVAYQAPLYMRFPRQEYWSGLYFFLQQIFPILVLNTHLLCLLHLQVDSLPLHNLRIYSYLLYHQGSPLA